jgi:hypothetical protein
MRPFEARPNGLWVPEGSREPYYRAGRLELTPHPSAPTDRLLIRFASWEALLGETMTFETVLKRIAELPFEPTMIALSALAGGLYHARHEPHLHLRLARDVLIEGAGA